MAAPHPRVPWMVLLAACGSCTFAFPPEDVVRLDCSGDVACPVDFKCIRDVCYPNDIADDDGDGLPNEIDTCPQSFDPEDRDHDGDGIGDACDNCPAKANSGQADDGEANEGLAADGVGNVCDPRAKVPGDRVVYFNGFYDALDDG